MTGTTHVCFKFTALKCIKWNINELSNKVSNNKTYHLQLQEELNKGWGGVEENQGPGGGGGGGGKGGGTYSADILQKNIPHHESN